MNPSMPDRLRVLLANDEIIVMPCCFDPLSAKLIEQEGFPVSFMSGFAASAARRGMPFVEIRTRIGFDDYFDAEKKYGGQ